MGLEATHGGGLLSQPLCTSLPQSLSWLLGASGCKSALHQQDKGLVLSSRSSSVPPKTLVLLPGCFEDQKHPSCARTRCPFPVRLRGCRGMATGARPATFSWKSSWLSLPTMIRVSQLSLLCLTDPPTQNMWISSRRATSPGELARPCWAKLASAS